MHQLNEIIRKLQDRKMHHIAKITGLHPVTIARIRDGVSKDIKSSTLEKLAKYFEENQ